MNNNVEDISKDIQAMIMAISRFYIRNDRGFEHRGQRKILSILYDQGSLSLNDIAKQLGVTSGSASEMVTKLEQKGYISKVQDVNDRRRIGISITDSGRIRVEAHRAGRQHRGQNRRAVQITINPFSSLNEEETIVLKKLLAKVLANLDQN